MYRRNYTNGSHNICYSVSFQYQFFCIRQVLRNTIKKTMDDIEQHTVLNPFSKVQRKFS